MERYFHILAVMEAFAINNIFRRSKRALSKKLKIVIALSMVTGTLTSLFYFIFVVMNVSPWYEPKSFIPIAGMLIGNSI
ncbi:ABC transporter permease [Eubacteriales bacterium KG125]